MASKIALIEDDNAFVFGSDKTRYMVPDFWVFGHIRNLNVRNRGLRRQNTL